MEHDPTVGLPRGTVAQGAADLYGDVLAPGALAGEYVIEGLLSEGGCGRVYAARHRVLGRRAAVKVLHPELAASPDMVERFVFEARAVNLIRHANIVDIHDFGQLPDRRPFYVMELVEGSDLRELVRARGRFSARDALALLEPVCAALAAAHAAGIVHRDLKAGNIIVGARDGARVVKLLDFGIAKLIEPSAPTGSSGGTRIGTPHAMAPEQIRGERVDGRTDVYALGVLLHLLVTGSHPFEGNPIEVERMHLEDPPPRASARAPVPAAVDALILRCLEKAPERRFAGVAELVAALRQAVDGAAPEGEERACAAVGLYLEAWIEGNEADDLDDDAFDALHAVVETAAARLLAAGLSLPLRGATTLLGVLAGPGAPPLARALAERLVDELAGRASLRVVLHGDDAVVAAHADGGAVARGPILRLAAWVPRERRPGLQETAAFGALRRA